MSGEVGAPRWCNEEADEDVQGDIEIDMIETTCGLFVVVMKMSGTEMQRAHTHAHNQRAESGVWGRAASVREAVALFLRRVYAACCGYGK